MQNEKSTIVGFFSDAWDAQRAMEELKFIGFEGRIRYVQNDVATPSDSSKFKGNVTGFMAKLYGFEDEAEYLDSRGNWTVSPEAEDYFAEAYHTKHHVILIQANEESESHRAVEILSQHHGRVETQAYAFFANALYDQERAIADGVHNIPPTFHPTTAIEPPAEKF